MLRLVGSKTLGYPDLALRILPTVDILLSTQRQENSKAYLRLNTISINIQTPRSMLSPVMSKWTNHYTDYHFTSLVANVPFNRYHVPMHLKSHIDFITPSTALLSPDRKVKRSRKLNKRQSSGTCRTPPPTAQNFTLDRCSQGAFPECIRALYNIPRPGDAQPGNSFAIFELDQTYIQSDMDLFYQYVAPEIPVGTAPTNFLLNGAPFATNFTDNDAESNLDFQLAWPLVYPQNITLFDAIPSQSQLDSIVGLNLTQAQLGALAVVATLDDVLQSFDGVCTFSPDFVPG